MGASLAEELSNAIDGAELAAGGESSPGGDASGSTESAAPGGETGQESADRDAQGRFVSKQGEAGEQSGATQSAAQSDPNAAQGAQPAQAPGSESHSAEARSLVTPPATWSASAKAIYAQLPEAARREIVKRELDFARGIQQHAEKARGYDTLMAQVQPYEAMIRSENSTPDRAIASLLQSAYVLRTAPPQQKAQLIMQIAQQYGADLSPYFSQQAEQSAGQQDLSSVQQMVHQLVAPHIQKIQQWEMSQAEDKRRRDQQMDQEIQSQVMAFQSATNEDGSPKHLYFENVRGLMGAYYFNGQAESLDQAYEMACWAHPEVRAALQSEQQRSVEAQRLGEAQRRAREAKQSGFDVSGQGGVGIAGANQTSLRDELSQQLDAAMSGQRV